ncbi:hypothetical protein MT325_m057R [Paramecium bursaria chlorella virus MT325]|uniref:Uncharacterized protein m057R n=1 Tax=Paramecium bursaria Chlorella virus MT325 TaxID=346932 RepID=A7ITD7_PBCVM|nr:hypothetical protein MT325_m057R [Paramecium bursaria chlorella virus MT325]
MLRGSQASSWGFHPLALRTSEETYTPQGMSTQQTFLRIPSSCMETHLQILWLQQEMSSQRIFQEMDSFSRTSHRHFHLQQPLISLEMYQHQETLIHSF